MLQEETASAQLPVVVHGLRRRTDTPEVRRAAAAARVLGGEQLHRGVGIGVGPVRPGAHQQL